MNSQQFVVLISLTSFLSIPFPSSNEYRYPCPDCGKGFTDPAPRIRHRKAIHGYQPHHTPRYYARRALKEAEKRAKAGLKKTGDQKAANDFPPSTQSASSSSSSSADFPRNLLANATYHDDFWKLLVDVPHRNAPGPNFSEDAQISAPVAVAPARETPKSLRSGSDLFLPRVETGDGVPLCDYQLGTIVQPQSRSAFDQSWAAYGHTIPWAASDHLPLAFPTLSGQSTYPGTTFQSLPTFSYTNDSDASFLPNSFDSPTSSPSYSGPPLLEPVPVLGWRPSSFLDIPTPTTPIKTEFSTGEPNEDSKTWYQSNNFA